MMGYFTYNGVSSADLGIIVTSGVSRPLLMTVSPITMDVPGRDGVYLAGQRRKERIIEVPIAIEGDTADDVADTVRTLAEWLVYPDPAPLIFSDELDKTYYAVLADEGELNEISTYRTGVLRFYCPDPYAYTSTPTQVAMAMGANTITNDGNADVYPIYKFKLKQSDGGSAAGSTFLSLRNEATDAEILCGIPDSVDETASAPDTRQLYESGNSMDGWSTGNLCELGTATGTMVSNGSTISPLWTGGSFGTGAAWHGPCVTKSLTAAATDFKLTTSIGFKTEEAQLGRIEIFLLDAAQAVVARVILQDAWVDYRQAHWQVRLGPSSGTNRVMYEAKKTYGWTDMSGSYSCALMIQRIGDWWNASIGRYNSSTGVWEYKDAIAVVDDRFDADIAQVAVTMSAYGTHDPVTTLWMNDIAVTEFATLGDDVPFVFYPGDEVIIDTQASIVSRVASTSAAAESLMPYMDITSQFFALAPGENTVTLSLGEDIEIDTTYEDSGAWIQERWL